MPQGAGAGPTFVRAVRRARAAVNIVAAAGGGARGPEDRVKSPEDLATDEAVNTANRAADEATRAANRSADAETAARDRAVDQKARAANAAADEAARAARGVARLADMHLGLPEPAE
jgi:hypothetical protein